MKIYRFEKNDQERIDAIKDGKIFLSAPENFNDLEDCRLNGISYPETDSEYLGKIKYCIDLLYGECVQENLPFSNEIFSVLKDYLLHPGEGVESSLIRNGAVASIRDYLKSTVGVCCFFSGYSIHPLMWAHYADNHAGFCAEYEISSIEPPFYKVNYTTESPVPSIYELLLCPHESFKRILTTKSHEWSYEKEVRLLFLKKFNPQNSISGVLEARPNGMKLTRVITGAKFDKRKSSGLNDLGVKVIPYSKHEFSEKNS